MKTILITGANGQLGRSLRRLAEERKTGYRFLFTDVETLDITDRDAVLRFVEAEQVDYLLNCAAYTAVDRAEEEEGVAFRLNCSAVRNLGEAASRRGATLLHVSTDYVFDGTSCRPYTEEDRLCPVSAYGRTKRAGEEALREACPDAVILRTAWLYSEYGNNFLKTMLRLGSEREELRVVFDQVGTPTYAGDLAEAMLAIVDRAEEGRLVSGIFHFSDEGVCSWYDFACRIIRLAGLSCRVVPIESREYPSATERPPYSVLNKGKIKAAYGLCIPQWEESLAQALARLSSNK